MPRWGFGGTVMIESEASTRQRVVHRLLTAMIVVGLASTAMLMTGGTYNAAAATWSPPMQVAAPAYIWYTLDVEVGLNGIYVLSCVYGEGNGQLAQIFKSSNGGATWSDASPVFGGEPGMCLYKSAGKDVLIIAAGENLSRSTNNGASWKDLAAMPAGQGWRFMAVGTNASWTGAAVDNDIYVMGSLYGGQEIGFAKSVDGGQSWTTPQQLTFNDYAYNTMPRITSDGNRLYAIYEIASNNKGLSTIVTKVSNDWGASWSTNEKVLVANTGNSYSLKPYSFHTLSNARALMTYVDTPGNLDPATTTGHYGYYNFATMSYEPVGAVGGPDWMIDEGFSGNLVDGVFYVAWIKSMMPDSFFTVIMFSTSRDTGLSTGLMQPDATIVKGTAQVTWSFTAQMDGGWYAKMLNKDGMRYLTLVVTDTTPKRPVIVSSEKVVFADLGAYPNGWAFSGSVSILAGHTYQVTAKQTNGATSASVMFYNQVDYVQ